MTASRPSRSRASRPARMRTLGRLAAGATACVAILVGLAGPAHAATPPSVYGCDVEKLDVGWVTQTLWIQNNCSVSHNFRVIKIGPVANPCFTVPAHQKVGWRWQRPYAYVTTERC